ncbi:helix-turn-helix transcriptional regulator [Candidatus Kaiserbacteria bacterium]|nr:MAG: helix-turn-helix transcriptional regulator [Candidatus Kaiserbacteria bacterium]
MSAKDTAIKLRERGYSYTHIAKKTGLSVSTLSYHLSRIPYTPNKKTIAAIGKARSASLLTKSLAKKKTYEEARERAKKDIGIISFRDLFFLGLGTYIGEGSKTHDITRLVNSDYRVINLYIRWLESFGLDHTNFTIRIHLYPDSNIHESEEFWLKKTGFSRTQLQSVCIDKRVGKDRKRSGIHPYGTAHVTVHSRGNKAFGVMLARQIGAYMQEVLESSEISN